MIRVRFAPSPTGHLHIGGVRTALFNFLYARANQGFFLLRIEDTDRERSRPEFEREILESMKWLGLDWDEEVTHQSSKLERYREIAGGLVQQGLAYEENRDGKTAIKLKMPKKEAVFYDLVHDAVRFDTSLFDDLVIIKSDGYPTYHLACVVDDHDLKVSHVIRGDDHLSNTPRQIMIYEALEWKPPKYAHLPLILGDDGTPLSKRHGAVALQSFRDQGYLPQGLLNYFALLGWGSGDNQEFYKLQDLIKKFSIKRINKASTRFDIQKLDWLNGQHIKKLSESEYLEKVTEFYSKLASKFNPGQWKKLALLYRNRIKTFADLTAQAAYCFEEIPEYPEPQYQEFFRNRSLKAHLEAWLDKVTELSDFSDDKRIEAATREVAQGWGIEAKDLIHPLRFALTGKTVSPGLFELMSVLSKDSCLGRVRKFLQKK